MKQNLPATRPEEVVGVSYAPALLAAGFMCLLWGAISHWLLALCGLVLIGIAAWQWTLELGARELENQELGELRK